MFEFLRELLRINLRENIQEESRALPGSLALEEDLPGQCGNGLKGMPLRTSFPLELTGGSVAGSWDWLS
jgi:hypothetical protein